MDAYADGGPTREDVAPQHRDHQGGNAALNKDRREFDEPNCPQCLPSVITITIEIRPKT